MTRQMAEPMTPLFKKLNFKEQTQILCINAPNEFRAELKQIANYAKVIESPAKSKSAPFAIGFSTSVAEIKRTASTMVKVLTDDAVFWLCYPKKSSKEYKTDITRDSGWESLGQLGFEPVRQVAIDENWSALRFRRAEHIKKMVRTFAMTKSGKAKTAKSKQAAK